MFFHTPTELKVYEHCTGLYGVQIDRTGCTYALLHRAYVHPVLYGVGTVHRGEKTRGARPWLVRPLTSCVPPAVISPRRGGGVAQGGRSEFWQGRPWSDFRLGKFLFMGFLRSGGSGGRAVTVG